MEAIFGPDRADEFEARMQEIQGSAPHEREEIIIEALRAALEELNRGTTYVRTFRQEGAAHGAHAGIPHDSSQRLPRH